MKNFLLAAAASICFFTTSASAYVEPADSAAFDPLPWAELTPGRVYLTWTDADRVQPRRVVPAHAPVTADTVSAWRGETIGVRALLYSSTPSAGPLSLSLPGGDARYVRYVITDDQRSCGKHDFSLQPWTVADIIDLPGALPLDGREVRPIWCSVTVPADAPAGPNDYRLTVSDDNGREVGSLSLTVNVDASRTLPPAEQWKFHTDFWQQPYALSRHDGLERWSPEHFEALRPYMRQLARSGQKVVTAILFYEPWGDQSHDKFDPMVATTRRADGSWAFGYDIFDRYVEMMDSCGINGLINCFSMIPWDMSFRYLDEASGEYRTLQTQTSSAEYADLWSAFIKDFAAHLRARGWFDKTCIAMDERGLGAMLDAYALVQQTEPELKMALAGNRHPELVDKLYDYCITVRQDFTPEELEARRKAGEIPGGNRVRFEQGDSLALPYADGTYDLVTIAYGVRNFAHLDRGLTEICRTLRPGGTICVIELSVPANPVMRAGYNLYSNHLIPLVGRWVSGDKSAYTYLPQSGEVENAISIVSETVRLSFSLKAYSAVDQRSEFNDSQSVGASSSSEGLRISTSGEISIIYSLRRFAFLHQPISRSGIR